MMRIAGRWRITQADLGTATLNLVAPAFTEFAEDRSGSFGFIAVQEEMDCREMERDGRPGVEFSWEGNDEAAMAEPGEDIPAEGVWAELGVADDQIGHRSEVYDR